jgi:regulator of CtrA degradation
MPAMLERRLIDSLYTEAMLLGDEARGYFDDSCRDARDSLSPLERVQFSVEALKITTRLMHIISWLLTQRAVDAGEITPHQALAEAHRMRTPIDSDAAIVAALPDEARALAEGSVELYRRVTRLDASLDVADAPASPAHQLLDRLKDAL